MADYIPSEIQAEIMKKLPVKSLLRYRSVSKSWKSLIDSSKFIFDHKTHPHPHHLLVSYIDPQQQCIDRACSDYKYVSIIDDDNDINFLQHQHESSDVPLPIRLRNKPKILGASQGLFCCFYRSKPIIWNPSIRKSVTLDCYINTEYDDIGFGVCPQTNDPKLVKIKPDNVLVFSLSCGIWRSLSRLPPDSKTNVPRKSIEVCCDVVAINRFICWHAFTEDDSEDKPHWMIVLFNLTTEEFTEACVPDSISRKFSPFWSISKLRESLVIIDHPDPMNPFYTIWKMEHGSDTKVSYTRLFTIKEPWPSGRLLHGFRKNGKPIFSITNGSEVHFGRDEIYDLFVYEPNSQHLNRIGISGKGCSFYVESYMETLLLLDYRSRSR